MTTLHHPEFQGFFLTDLDRHPETDAFQCVLTRYGQPIGTAQSTHADRPAALHLPEADARAFLALEQHLFLDHAKGNTLMNRLLLHFSFDQLSQERQLVQARTFRPDEVAEQFQFPLGTPVEAITAAADDPRYAPGLVQRYVQHQGWQPLVPRDATPFQGFALLNPITEPGDEFQCVLQLDGQALGYLLTHPADERLQIHCAPVHVQAFLHLAQTLDPADHDGSRLVETMIHAHAQ